MKYDIAFNEMYMLLRVVASSWDREKSPEIALVSQQKAAQKLLYKIGPIQMPEAQAEARGEK